MVRVENLISFPWFLDTYISWFPDGALSNIPLKEKKKRQHCFNFQLYVLLWFLTYFFALEIQINPACFFTTGKGAWYNTGIGCVYVCVCALTYHSIYLSVLSREVWYSLNVGYPVLPTVIFQPKMSCTYVLVFFPYPHPHSTQLRYHSLNLQPTHAI